MALTSSLSVLKAREDLDNYLIIYNEAVSERNTCAIYFSSNALYYPDNDEVFCKTIFDKTNMSGLGEGYQRLINTSLYEMYINNGHKRNKQKFM